MAALEEETARKRDAEADAADREEMARRRAEKAQEELNAKLRADRADADAKAATAARCAGQRDAREAAEAGLEAEVAKAKETFERRQKVEKWIASHCHAFVHKEYGTELVPGKNGAVIARQVVVEQTPFQACPAKTPADIADEGGLSYDDALGWTRETIPPMPPKPEEVRAARVAAIAQMMLPDCEQ